MNTNSDLYDYCRRNQPEKVLELLQAAPYDLNIMYKDGAFFRLAISKNSSLILKALLQYFKDHELSAYDDKDSMEYKIAITKLRDVLKDAIEYNCASDEIEDILYQYIGSDDVQVIYRHIKNEYGELHPILNKASIEIIDLNEDTNDSNTELKLKEVYMSLKKVLREGNYSYNISDREHAELSEFEHNLKSFIIESGLFGDHDVAELGLFSDLDSDFSDTDFGHANEILDDISLRSHSEALRKPSNSIHEVKLVSNIVYDNPLLNHPELLKESLKLFDLGSIVDLCTKLDQELIAESIRQNNSSLIFAGLMSFGSCDDLIDSKDHLNLSGNHQHLTEDPE